MTADTDGLLTDEERTALREGTYDDADHQALDNEVHYRIRQYAVQPDGVDAETAEAIAADVRLLGANGHGAIVSMVEERLGEYLPEE